MNYWTRRFISMRLLMFYVLLWRNYQFWYLLRTLLKLFLEHFMAHLSFVELWLTCQIHFMKVRKLIYSQLNYHFPSLLLFSIPVCCSLISNGERYEEETYLGRARLETLRSLCRLCPNQILLVRTKCVR